jgi:aspartate oxidase
MDDLKTFDQKIKTLMTKYVGIIRHAEGLNIALKELTKIEKQLLHSQFQPSIGLRIIQNKLAVAKLVTQVALCRTESRGAHFRSDG